jgi:hypothetical protein
VRLSVCTIENSRRRRFRLKHDVTTWHSPFLIADLTRLTALSDGLLPADGTTDGHAARAMPEDDG